MLAIIWQYQLINAQIFMEDAQLLQVAIQKVLQWHHFCHLVSMLQVIAVGKMNAGLDLFVSVQAHCISN